jgi:hypothetical protein
VLLRDGPSVISANLRLARLDSDVECECLCLVSGVRLLVAKFRSVNHGGLPGMAAFECNRYQLTRAAPTRRISLTAAAESSAAVAHLHARQQHTTIPLPIVVLWHTTTTSTNTAANRPASEPTIGLNWSSCPARRGQRRETDT